MPETMVGRYRLSVRLGTGAFATVWQGFDDQLDATVAIKILADNWSHDHDVRARFIAEARLLRRVRDQRVVRVHDIGELPDGRPYFVMDFADGGTLADLLSTPEPMTTGEALRLGAETARAVAVLHDHGIAHRDIKPQNLLLTSDAGPRLGGVPRRSVIVADLGMAKSLAEASGFTVTAGTPAYMAPEQALGLGFDQRADVYSVAAVTYTLLAGRPPFEGSGLAELAEPSRDSTPKRLGLDHVGAIDDVLAAALAFDPDHRPVSATELGDRLSYLADVTDPAEAPTLPRLPVVPRSPDSTPPTWTASTPPSTPPSTSSATSVRPAPRPVADPPTYTWVDPSLAVAKSPRTPVAVVLGGAVLLAAAMAVLTWLLLSAFL